MAGLSDVSGEYFSDLNPTAARIYKEITLFSGLLGERWNALPQHEKDCLIDDHIVPPDIRDRYGDHWDAEQEEQYYPRLILKGGGGVVVDTDGETWDDEHSGPFSWETSSQSELSLDELLTDKPRQHLKDPKRCKSPARGGGAGGGGGGGVGTTMGRVRTSGALFDSSPVGGGSDFDQLRSMWEQGNVTSAAAAGGTADDGVRVGTGVTSAASASDAADGQLHVSSSKASMPVAAESAKELPEAGASDPAAAPTAAPAALPAQASGAVPAVPSRGPSTLPLQTDRRVGTLPGKAAAATTSAAAAAAADAATAAAATSLAATANSAAIATATSAAATGGGTTTAANVNDDPVFVQHRVTFGTARPAVAPGRGGRARPQSGGHRTAALETAGSASNGADEAVKTGFDFLDDW